MAHSVEGVRFGRGFRLVVGLGLVVALLGLSGSAGGAEKASRQGRVSLLYAVTAGGGSLREVKGKGAVFALTLRAVARSAVYFSDRPVRRSGAFPAGGIAGGWRGFGFAADPPNAALTFEDREGVERTMILSLRSPRYSPKRRALEFRARPVGRAAGVNLREHARVAERPGAAEFRRATLFIDDAEAINLDGCIFAPYQDCLRLEYRGARFLVGIEAQGSTWTGFSLSEANLNGANLEGLTTSYSKIENSQMQRVNLKGASLARLDLQSSNLEGANLAGADLEEGFLLEANFERANLSNVNLTKAALNGANFSEANLRGAKFGGPLDFERVSFYNTIMPDGSLCSGYEAEGCSTSG